MKIKFGPNKKFLSIKLRYLLQSLCMYIILRFYLKWVDLITAFVLCNCENKYVKTANQNEVA